MRGDYELSNDRHPFQVQYIGLDELCIRNLSNDEVVQRETKVSGPLSKSQWDRLDARCLQLSRANKGSTGNLPQGQVHETLAETAIRLAASH